jgi:2-oxoglutarate ferredoxin oxidoreductase subunit alpha
MEDLTTDGVSSNFLQIRFFSPFPTTAVEDILRSSKKTIGIEQNYSAQAMGLIREKTGIAVGHKVVKFNGRPFSQNEIYEAITEIIKSGRQEVVMNRG